MRDLPQAVQGAGHAEDAHEDARGTGVQVPVLHEVLPERTPFERARGQAQPDQPHTVQVRTLRPDVCQCQRFAGE